MPCLPLGDGGMRLCGSKRHIELSKSAACEGTVLLKNNNSLLPLSKQKQIAVLGKAQFDYTV